MKKIFSFMMMAVLALAYSSCSGSDGDGSGEGNTKDTAVTGKAQEVGMTYADLVGYVNIPEEYQRATEYYGRFRVGVNYGTSEYALNQTEYGTLNGRTINVTLRGLEANTAYYYQTFIQYGNSEYYLGELIESYETIGVGKEVASFTTKPASFNGTMTVGTPKDVTFRHATISGSVDASSLNYKESYTTGFVYSTNRSSLTGQLASKLSSATHEDTSEWLFADDYASGRYINGDLHFATNGEEEITIFMDAGSTVYYSPYIIISGQSFTGDIGQVTSRNLPQRTGFIDLGLSCKWSAINLEAESPWDMGGEYRENTAQSKMTTQFGSDAKFPSKEQVEELNSCTLESIDNGVLITGPNGNQIFIPCTPFKYNRMYDNYRYMTSSADGGTVGSGKYSYYYLYSILFQYNSGQFKTYRSATEYYNSMSPNRYNYSYCFTRPVKE